MKPSDTEIEAVYAIGEAAGMTRAEIDAIAVPHIQILGVARTLSNVRSRGELRVIATMKRPSAPSGRRSVAQSNAHSSCSTWSRPARPCSSRRVTGGISSALPMPSASVSRSRSPRPTARQCG